MKNIEITDQMLIFREDLSSSPFSSETPRKDVVNQYRTRIVTLLGIALSAAVACSHSQEIVVDTSEEESVPSLARSWSGLRCPSVPQRVLSECELEQPNLLMEVKYDMVYDHDRSVDENVNDLLKNALGINNPSWFREPISDLVRQCSSEWRKVLPRTGRKPDKENHVRRLSLENGLIIFYNFDRDELLRMDIFNVFQDREVLRLECAVKRITEDRIEKRWRERHQREEDEGKRKMEEYLRSIP